MAFGSSEGFSPPPASSPDLELWFAQIHAEVKKAFSNRTSEESLIINADGGTAGDGGLVLRDASITESSPLSGSVAGHYFQANEWQSSRGGVTMRAFLESGASTSTVRFLAYGPDPTTSFSSTAKGALSFFAGGHDGAGAVADLAANALIFTVGGRTGAAEMTGFAVSVEGETFARDSHNVNPGSDTDVDLLTVGVTGTPTLSWNETFSRFDFSTGISVGGRLTVGAGSSAITIESGVITFPPDGSGSISSGGIPLVMLDDTSGAEILVMDVNAAIGGGSLNILGSATPTAGHLDVAIGNAITGGALATTADEGFLLIPGGSGPPTGTPINAQAGWYPLYYDATNDEVYIYNGSWRSVALA